MEDYFSSVDIFPMLVLLVDFQVKTLLTRTVSTE